MTKLIFMAAFLLFAPATTFAAETEIQKPETVFGKDFFCLDGFLHLKRGHDFLPVYVQGGKVPCQKCPAPDGEAWCKEENPSTADQTAHIHFNN